MQVLAFRHAPLEGLGTMADNLRGRGIDYQVADLYLDPVVPDLAPYAGLIVMGGPMSVNDDFPWLRLEIAAVQRAIERGMPLLGVCLGAQMIARAMGARVYPNARKEIGWGRIEWTAAARADRVFGGRMGFANVFQWHGETFDLPAGADLLATGEVCRHQAFRARGNVYGVQFHPEVTPGTIVEWQRQDDACGELREAGGSIDAKAHAAETAALAAAVCHGWCTLLR